MNIRFPTLGVGVPAWTNPFYNSSFLFAQGEVEHDEQRNHANIELAPVFRLVESWYTDMVQDVVLIK